jgi:hypothetical protein
MVTDMSDDLSGFAPPPFKPADALEQLRRSLRGLQLAERGNGFELRGKRVVELQAEATAIDARIARKLALTPEWDRLVVRSAPDQRKLVDEIKKRLARWEREE